ncbi:hypothetical protein CUR178_01533 [Leishmania enriettii]|uniref:SEC7 domain-containing protein n=1 Tax=Leishmania enriettii TaxID=5663 RepID=A0A836KK58_LEIEN|nr:hypothetical protein CUR178_01533 [Leishmania enriettii]
MTLLSALAPDRQPPLSESGETDRQMVLLHVDNTLLAIRTSQRLSYRSGSLNGREANEYAVAQELLDLQRRLFAGAVPVPASTSCSSPEHVTPQSKMTATRAFPTEALPACTTADHGSSKAKPYEVSEVMILRAFANVCRSPNTSAVVTGVALTALVDMLDFPCAFVSMEGVCTAIEAASETRAEVHDSASHEALLSRIFSVYVAALNHPAAVMADGSVHVRALGRMMGLATHPEASQLLKRTVEKSMRLIVMTLFRRLLSLSADEAAHAALVAAGATVLRFISRLISGEIASFDNDGCEVASTVTLGSSEGSAGTATSSGGGDDKATHQESTIALNQLEGLSLAQGCLLLLRCSLSKPSCAPLLDAVQNQLCRALLIASVRTTRAIVLAQALRTAHLVMQGCSEHLIPQIYNFIRVLHLNPLEVLTSELADASAGQPGSPVGRGSSPSAARPPGSPSGTASSGHGNFGRLSAQQLRMKQERRDILLESLAEFCSDPRFGSFCFIHYDLSWRYASLLPQLFRVLASHASTLFQSEPEEAVTTVWTQRRSGMAGDRKAAAQRRQRAAAAADSRRDSRQRSMAARGLLRSTQRMALDAATNMVCGIALRAIAAGGASPSRLTESYATPSAATATTSSAELYRLIQHALKEKEKLNRFAALFEDSPIKKGIPFLLEHAIRVPAGAEEESSLRHCTKLVLAEPAGGREVGEALYRLSIVLNKRVLGNYIGEQGRNEAEDAAATEDAARPAALFSVRFFEEQLDGFIHQFEFRNKPLLEAIREMVYLLCLPGESQKIDRVMESFAKHWYQQNLTYREDGTVAKDDAINPFHSESGAFVLSFAIIMLNTDQHSGKVAHQMRREDFAKMNRSIDDGKDISTAYLDSIYDDVRQHEVVMADMMDRGFANNTTWRLEMQPCVNFMHHALNAKVQAEEVEAIQVLGSISSHELGATTTVTRAAFSAAEERVCDPRSTVLRTFDLFLFQSLWKGCLPVFDSMLGSAVDEVSLSIVATGATVEHAVEEAEQQLPAEMAILQSSLRGVCMLVRAAHALGLPAVADQCFVRLLKYAAMSDLTSGEEEVRALYRSVPKLLCVREIFALFVDIYRSLGDSWLPLSRLILNMQLMGLLAEVPQAAAEGSPKPCGAENGDAETVKSNAAEGSLPALADPLYVLLQDPGICANVFAPLTAASAGGGVTTKHKASSERGWFSSLFGGNGAQQMSVMDLSELRDARGRISSCIPSMRQLLAILWRVTADAQAGCLCVNSFSAVSSIEEDVAGSLGNGCSTAPSEEEAKKGNGHARGVDEASAYAASFELAFICAVVGGASTPEVLQPEQLTRVTSRIGRLLREVELHLHDTRASDGVRTYWCALGSRVVCASLQLMAVHWRGQYGALAMAQLWACWMHAAPSIFAAVVARPLAAFLYDQVVEIGDAGCGSGAVEGDRDAMLPWESGSEVLLLLAPFAAHASAVSDVVVQRQISSLLLRMVRQRRYSIAEDTEGIVSLCMSFSAWLPQIRASASSTAVADTPESSAVAATNTKGARAAAATFLASDASLTEVLSLCGRNVLLDSAGAVACGAAGETDEWCGLWVFVLRGLGALALCSADARDGSEAIFCLQRALLDSEAHDLPSSAVVAVYKDILIPLTELLCVPRARVHTGLRWTGASGAALGEKNGSASSFRRGVLGTLFNSLLSPASPERSGYGESAASATGNAAPSRRPTPSALVSTEVKCRLLGLVPKVLLRYTAALTTQPDLLLSLWTQVLGTLYVVYSAYPGIEGTARCDFGGGSTSLEDAMLVQEAVEETVKNMIYVAASTWHELSSSSAGGGACSEQQHAATFWAAIGRLLLPFAFSAPLVGFMVEAGLLRVEAGADVANALDAAAPAL